jgi:beta-lactamase class A
MISGTRRVIPSLSLVVSGSSLCLAMTFGGCGNETRAGSHTLRDLEQQFETIAETARGRVGVAAELLETGEAAYLEARQSFPMQSVYKLPIGMAVLHQVDQGLLNLNQLVQVNTNDFVPVRQHSPIRDDHPLGVELSVRELMRSMIAESDGTASDVLLRLAGGTPPVNRYLRSLGITNVVVATTEKEMGRDEAVQYRNWASPEGMAALLRAVHAGGGLSSSSRTRLIEWMTRTTTGPARIKGLLPAGTVVAHKTGSSRTVDGLARATNDAGLITLPDGRHLALAIFVSDSTADEITRETVIAKISRAAWNYWSRP